MDLMRAVKLIALYMCLGFLLLACGCMDLSNESGLGNPPPTDATASNPETTPSAEIDPAAAIEQELALRRNEAESILFSQKAVDAQLLFPYAFRGKPHRPMLLLFLTVWRQNTVYLFMVCMPDRSIKWKLRRHQPRARVKRQ